MIDWRAFLDLADELAHRPDVAAARTAISRSYYAAFHHARDYLDAKGPPVPCESRAHRVVWHRIRNLAGATPKRIAGNGERLKAMRRAADYDAVYPEPDVYMEAREAIRMARDLLNDLAELPAP